MDYIYHIAQRHQQRILGSSITQITAVIEDAIAFQISVQQAQEKSTQLIDQLVELSSTFIFPEYYSHTNEIMWKIKNPFTNYAEEKIVLSSIKEPITKALKIAIDEVTKKKLNFFADKNLVSI